VREHTHPPGNAVRTAIVRAPPGLFDRPVPHPTAQTLVAGRLHALGDCIENDGWISWLPPDRGGYESLNAHLLVEGRAGLMIDTSLPIAGPAIVEQAARFDLDELTIVLTRGVEFESVGNAELVAAVLPLRRLYVHYGAWQWIFFRERTAPPEAELGWEPISLQKDTRIALGPERAVQMLDAPLRLLASAWAYDEATRTLFTSDCFSHVMAPDPARRVVTAEHDTTTPDAVLAHLARKYDWLEDADTDVPRRRLDHVLATHAVERIAPTNGCVLEGADVVARHAAMLDDALRALGRGAVAA